MAAGIAIAGQITQAACHRKLANRTLIIDRNRLQQGAQTEENSGLDPPDNKVSAFGREVTMGDDRDTHGTSGQKPPRRAL